MYLEKILLQNNMQLVKENRKLNKEEYVTYMRVNDMTEYNQEKLKEYNLTNAIYIYVGKTNNLSKRNSNFGLRYKDKLSGKNKENKAGMDDYVMEKFDDIIGFYMQELGLNEKEAYNKTMKEKRYVTENVMSNVEALKLEKQIQKQIQVAMIQNALGFADGKEVILMNNYGVPCTVKKTNDNKTVNVGMTQKEAKKQNKIVCDEFTRVLKMVYNNSDEFELIQEGNGILVKVKKHSKCGKMSVCGLKL